MWWLWIIIVLAVLCIAATAGIFVFTFYNPPKLRKDDYYFPPGHTAEPFKDEICGLIDKLRERPCEDVYTDSFDGLRLHARYYHSAEASPLVICCHGYRSTAFKDFCAGSQYLLEKGFNVLIIDERAHGTSGGNVISFGINERQDVLTWANWAVRRFGPVPMYLFGISMGAATVMMVTGERLPSNVKACVEDAGFSTALEEFAHVYSTLKEKPPISSDILLPIMRRIAMVRAGYDLNRASPLDAVKRSVTPTLFIHGEADDFIPISMMHKLFEAASCEKMCMVVPKAEHVQSAVVDPEGYWDKVDSFLKLVDPAIVEKRV